MKIIKTPSKEIQCHKCDTFLEITNEDLIERKDVALWFARGKYFINCPICGQEISFKEMIKEGGEK